MVYVLNVLSEVAPDWVCAHVPAEWVERYGQRLEEERLPKEEQERTQYANQVGADGWDATRCAPGSLHSRLAENASCRDHPPYRVGATVRSTRARGQWRKEPVLSAAQLIASPYDLDARNGKKRSTFWTGYKVHFTQTCDEDAPQLITVVQTTAAPLSDEGIISAIYADLAEKELLPDQHLVDSGYVTIANLVQSQSDHEVDLLGPTLKTHWYQAETGYDLSHFSIDWETETVTCPQGQVNSSWTPIQREGKLLIQVRFSQTDCKACPSRASCTGTTRRTLTFHSQEQTQALLAARQREHTDAFKEVYRHRAGIEGTHAQAVRTMGLRRSRYIGLRKTHLGHVAVAAAINLVRLTSFLRGEASEQIRTSAFKRAMKQVA